MILQKLKADAEGYLGETYTEAVNHCPGLLHGTASARGPRMLVNNWQDLIVLRILNEPTAAALAYGIDQRRKTITVLVF